MFIIISIAIKVGIVFSLCGHHFKGVRVYVPLFCIRTYYLNSLIYIAIIAYCILIFFSSRISFQISISKYSIYFRTFCGKIFVMLVIGSRFFFFYISYYNLTSLACSRCVLIIIICMYSISRNSYTYVYKVQFIHIHVWGAKTGFLLLFYRRWNMNVNFLVVDAHLNWLWFKNWARVNLK